MERKIWKTKNIIEETLKAITIVFDTLGEPFSYKAGQFINLSMEIDGEFINRSYSLSSTPGVDKYPAITIKRVKGGLVSNYVLNEAHSIKKWYIDGPYGMYTLPANATCQTLTFITGGSGITPIFSLIKEALYKTSCPIILIYSNKTPDQIIFYNELELLKNQFPDRIKIQYVFTENFKKDNFRDQIHGRINKLVLKKLLGITKYTDFSSSIFFLCGPEGLIKNSNDALISFGVPNENIQVEYFTIPENDAKQLLPSESREVQLHFYERTNLLEVEPGKTILETALSEHVPVPYSCKTGICGVCKAKVLTGKVHMRNNFALEEHMLNEGYVLLCQTHPLDNEVTVEIG